MRAVAALPSGATNWLLLIKDWNFNWQTDYRYASPVFLPKGTVISMQFTYDNSAGNIRNPNNPPKRVTYGPQATDEMAELWLQVLPRRREDFRALVDLFQSRMPAIWRGHHELQLRLNPNDPAAHLGLGAALLGTGEFDKAAAHLRRAAELKPDLEEAHFYLGYILRKQKSLSDAALAYQQVLRLNPTNHEAHGNLGLVCLEQGNLADAEVEFESALRIFPGDAIARRNLEFVRRAKVGEPKVSAR
jgi:tetratricopeptide (TPR) repeat protein